MQTRTVNGRQATDRDGAAEVLERSRRWVDIAASPKQRTETGFPEPVGREDRYDWYALDDLAAYRDVLAAPKQATERPYAPRSGPPDELISSVDFRAWLGVEQGTFKRYVQDSKPAWDEGRDGYLPLPADDEDYRTIGTIYYWPRHQINTWIKNRPGKEGATGHPVGETTTLADALAAIAAAEHRGEKMTGTKLAAALGVPLNRAYILLREARKQPAA